MEYKLFNDCVLGVMSFHPLLVVVADTHQVQRLRNIRQLGACSYVFPSANHSRFEHSLGTAFIAGKLFDCLKLKRTPTTVATDAQWEKQKLCVQIAALCHDIGHGPFSHAWELFRRRLGDDWRHEQESIKIFDELLEEEVSPTKKFNGHRLKTVRDALNFYGLSQDDVETIKKMILGQKREKNYLYQVVSNKNNEIDVDKWEYIARDSAMLNIPVSFDFNRVLNFCCVIQNDLGEEQICFRDKECSQLVEMFISRGKLHDAAYKHTKVKVIEEMLLDAFELANDRLHLATTPITDLTDHIYHKILYDFFGNDQEMRRAKDILRRIEKRHLYKCIAQETFEETVPDLKTIKQHLSDIKGIDEYMKDIGMTTVAVDMTRQNKKRPLKNVSVYRKRRGGQYACEPFNWNVHYNFLKPNLGKLKRQQVLLLYKGTAEFPEPLRVAVEQRLQQILKTNGSC